MARSPARKWYDNAVLGLSCAYGGALIGVELLFRDHPPTGTIAYFAAILPALPIVGIFAALGRYLIVERDEYLRMLMVRQMLVASGFALSIATIWGFLESFRLVEHVEAFYVAVLWFGGMGLGACVNKLTLGDKA